MRAIESTRAAVRFGFSAFTGEFGFTEPLMNSMDLALNNYQAVLSIYKPMEEQFPGERAPAYQALEQAAQQLFADPTPGKKYVFFVTDGDSDYCVSSSPACPQDTVIAKLQGLAAGQSEDAEQREPIETLVLAVVASGNLIDAEHLQN